MLFIRIILKILYKKYNFSQIPLQQLNKYKLLHNITSARLKTLDSKNS